MAIKVQGTVLSCNESLIARVRTQPGAPANQTSAVWQVAFNIVGAGAGKSFISMTELFPVWIASMPAAIAAEAQTRFAQVKSSLLSNAQIMRVGAKTVSLTQIPNPFRNHVTSVLRHDRTSGLPCFNHVTDPRTGQAARAPVQVYEFYLPNAAGRRMTYRLENGKKAFYFSNGAHGQNQYHYHLITNSAGLPILKGSYPPNLILAETDWV